MIVLKNEEEMSNNIFVTINSGNMQNKTLNDDREAVTLKDWAETNIKHVNKMFAYYVPILWFY